MKKKGEKAERMMRFPRDINYFSKEPEKKKGGGHMLLLLSQKKQKKEHGLDVFGER